MPVAAGAGTILILTGTPWWRPIPETATGRRKVFSKRTGVLRVDHFTLISTGNRVKFNYLKAKEMNPL
jgi:hypothetical protein